MRIVFLDVALAIEHNLCRCGPLPEAVTRRLTARLEPPDLREAHRVTVVER
ncbi:MAG: hypothetical protein HC822_03945 [Oscillochloris sp.]|nr:hypothetical protein [Oscillochloris sp.]